jgi:hypothetical protein
MSLFLSASWPVALSALVALQASAQVNSPPATPAPATPTSATAQAVPAPLAYRSAFEGYQPFTDEKVAPWKDSNSTVQKIGGWRAYAKEAAEPESGEKPAPSATPVAPALPAAAPNPHAGHGKQ